MEASFPESDWKKFRLLHKAALDRHCQESLSQIKKLIDKPGQDMHERYRGVYELVHTRDKEVARLFDDFRRSTALLQLTAMRGKNLVTDEELAQFTQETQERVNAWLKIAGG